MSESKKRLYKRETAADAAEALIDRIKAINDGTADIPYYPLEPVPVTRENIDEVIIDGGFHQREDVYLNID